MIPTDISPVQIPGPNLEEAFRSARPHIGPIKEEQTNSIIPMMFLFLQSKLCPLPSKSVEHIHVQTSVTTQLELTWYKVWHSWAFPFWAGHNIQGNIYYRIQWGLQPVLPLKIFLDYVWQMMHNTIAIGQLSNIGVSGQQYNYRHNSLISSTRLYW